MLFAMMRLALLSYHRTGDEPPELRGKTKDMALMYRNSMSQCLILADFTKPHRHLLETFVIHIHGEYGQSRDSDMAVWVLVSMVARLAMCQGYHRDPKMFPNISVFEGEMRRRVWTCLRQYDLLFSFQVGLPCMVRIADTDSEIPRNLCDEDFDENSVELPPERPFDDRVPTVYMIAKSRLAFAFGRVLEYSQHVKGSSYEQVMEIDHTLREAHNMLPDHLRSRPITECSHEPSACIMARFTVSSKKGTVRIYIYIYNGLLTQFQFRSKLYITRLNVSFIGGSSRAAGRMFDTSIPDERVSILPCNYYGSNPCFTPSPDQTVSYVTGNGI